MPTQTPGAGSNYWLEVWTADPTTGAARDIDASANPTVTVRRNGSDDTSSWSWSWTKVATGHYQGASTVPAGYAAGDSVWISAAGTVNAIAGGAVADHFLVGADPLASLSIRTGTCQAGSTTTSVKLDAGASATSNLYIGAVLWITGGTGAGQARVIAGYNGGTKQAGVDRPLYVAPDATSTFAILPSDGPAVNSALQVSASATTTTIRNATAQAGSTSSTIKLDAGASATSGLYVNDLIAIVSGTGAGQSRTIVAYNGATKVATVSPAWITTPDGTSTFNILASLEPSQFSAQGVAAAGSSTTITLDSLASAVDSIYNGSLITILSGTGAGQAREVAGYVGSTKVVTVDSAWSTIPDTTSAYAVIPGTSSVPSAGDTPGTTTLLALLTPTRAGNLDNLDAAVSSRSTYAGGAVASVTAPVTAGTVTDKSGYSLADGSITSATFTVGSVTGVMTGILEQVAQIWRVFFRPGSKDAGTHTIKTLADDGTTVLTSQPYTDDGLGNETRGMAT